jgi:hypothetical protein
MNPLQERANVLKANLQKQAEAEKGYQQQHKYTVQEQLVHLFQAAFPELYQLLVQSQVSLTGEVTTQGQKVMLTAADKQLSVFYEGMKNTADVWRFYGKDYQASSKESEQQLIIALAEGFSQAQSKRVAGK